MKTTFNKLAKLTHLSRGTYVWQDFKGHVVESKVAESSRLGSLPPANPAKLLRKLPVVPVRGRWTSVYGSAQWWWDEPGPHHTPAAITKCLVKSAAVVPGPTCTEAEAPLLDEACAEVIARKGRWAREVSADVWSISFWADVCCLRIALKPATLH